MADDDSPQNLKADECREPTLEDVVRLCRALNQTGARYLVIGGFAIRAAGFARNTMDVDLLIEAGEENEARVIQALLSLPDQAARQIKPGEVAQFTVVRVADEYLVDLMKTAGGVEFAEAARDAVWHEVDGVRIPFASPQTLWRMKQTRREKDIPDRLFLRKLLEAEGIQVEENPPQPWARLRRWLERVFGRKR